MQCKRLRHTPNRLPRPLNGSRAQQSFSSLPEWLGIPGGIGDFQIDNGRELYVPVSILHGKLLYRDIWYMYGPWRRTNPPYTVMIYERKVVGQASSQTGGLQPN